MSTENTTPIYGAPVGLPFVSNLFQEAYAIAEESLKKSAEANEKYAACVEATAQAQVAANKANAIRGNLEAGGYIESLKELNNNEKFTAWVGSLAEYEAETEKRVNCLYIIEDEPTPVDYVIKRGTSITEATYIDIVTNEVTGKAADVNWVYKIFNSGECELSTHITLSLTNLTKSAAGGYFSDLISVKFPFTIEDRVIVGTANNLSIVTNVGSGDAEDATDLRILTHSINLESETGDELDFTGALIIKANLIVKGFCNLAEVQ